jgi:Arc/MetJ family transcription regulator
MKRLTLNLPDSLLETVMELSGSVEKTETVVAALRAYEAALRRERLLALRGRADLLAAAERGVLP